MNAYLTKILEKIENSSDEWLDFETDDVQTAEELVKDLTDRGYHAEAYHQKVNGVDKVGVGVYLSVSKPTNPMTDEDFKWVLDKVEKNAIEGEFLYVSTNSEEDALRLEQYLSDNGYDDVTAYYQIVKGVKEFGVEICC